LRAARASWIAARVPYMQTEAYRFGNAIVDDWEGKVNSWPRACTDPHCRELPVDERGRLARHG
jgi:uncharacterized iron-regulated protein